MGMLQDRAQRLINDQGNSGCRHTLDDVDRRHRNLFSALAMILHIFDFPVLFLAPGFYKLDFSEIPALVGTFAFGPVAGVMIEFCKILLKLVVKGTSTAFVGDLANFVIGCSLVLPAFCR